jgi:hypothetical protein
MREYGEAYKELSGENQRLEVTLGYSNGGVNMMSGKEESKGYYIFLRTIIKSDGCSTFQMIGDITGNNIKNGKIFVEPAKRRGQKKYDAIWDKLDTSFILDEWEQENYDKVFDYIKEIR